MIVLNLLAVAYRWDPYPFILLNLVFSTQAAYAAPLILTCLPSCPETRDPGPPGAEDAGVTFELLALITITGLAGRCSRRYPSWGRPLVVGDIAAGVLLGRTGLGWIDAGEPTTALLSEVGFAMLMFVVGTRLPLRDPGLRD